MEKSQAGSPDVLEALEKLELFFEAMRMLRQGNYVVAFECMDLITKGEG